MPINLATGEHKKPEFLALQPFGIIPVYEDEDVRVYGQYENETENHVACLEDVRMCCVMAMVHAGVSTAEGGWSDARWVGYPSLGLLGRVASAHTVCAAAGYPG